MTLYVGVDETIIEDTPMLNWVIYVASCSHSYEKGQISENKSGKGKFSKGKTTRNKIDVDLEELDGFLFATFGLEKNSLNQGCFKRKQTEAVFYLLSNSLYIAESLGILSRRENIEITIDGSDTFRIGKDLSDLLQKQGYGEEKTSIEFIVKGDRKVGVVNFSDIIAYNLRYLRPRDTKPQSGNFDMLKQTNNPRVKKLLPFYLGNKDRNFELETSVA